ncbi:hypothetical protein GOBAR_DD22947 [Gossypium barbadense]|nr:hypothetical protein GOBAR_DD22947 [Gossypium barbadense]
MGNVDLYVVGAIGARIEENVRTKVKANSRIEGKEDVGTEGGDNVDSEGGEDDDGDFIVEDEIKENKGKIEGNETEYIDSSEPKKYRDNKLSDDEIDTSYLGKKIVGPRYDPNCFISLWEIGLRFEDNQ